MKPPPFVGLFKAYPPGIHNGEENIWGGRRWQQEQLMGVDAEGNVWGLYMDSCAKPPALRWIKFETETADPPRSPAK